MSNSDDEEIFGFYGRPLEQYDEDEIPKKKPITVEEQIATDAQGRRRFHGAFTGGFSAGFFNTVGSVEGWTPSEFKSSRSEKAQSSMRKPEDYMDDEDVGEFGIAPQRVRATKEYNTSRKRKKQVFADGPIPGEPVLHSLIEGVNETIGYLLLRNMGFKHEKTETTKVYGCEMPAQREITKTFEDTSVIPEIYINLLKNPKVNTFGIGYVGLDKSEFSKQSSKFVMKDSNDKRLSISGQAFGVGAFEEEDEDIYVKEDLSKYDFELTSEKASVTSNVRRKMVLDMFLASRKLAESEKFPPPAIPASFTGKHKVKKSRFEQLPQENVEKVKMNADLREIIIGDNIPRENKEEVATKPPKANETTSEKFIKLTESVPKIDFISDRFVKSSEGVLTEDDNKPSSDLISDKFTRAELNDDNATSTHCSGIEHGTHDMREAARLKMFGKLTRVTLDFYPNALVCKRFNVPESVYTETTMKPNRPQKIRIFEEEAFPEEINLKPGLSHTLVNKEVTTPKIQDTMNDKTEDDDKMEVHQESAPPIEEVEKISETKSKPHDLTVKMDISKNVDLFKAIFLDDSDEEDNETAGNDEAERQERDQELKDQILGDSLMLPSIAPVNSKGLLSNMFDFEFPPRDKMPERNESEVAPVKEETQTDDVYGPKIPSTLVRSNYVVDEKDDDQWVEKSAEKSSKREHKKKKHKKHKHKKHK